MPNRKVLIVFVTLLAFAAIEVSAQTPQPDAVVAALYRHCGTTKQVTDLDATTLVQYFLQGTARSIIEDGSNLRAAKFDALYVTPNARIAGLSIAKAEYMTLLRQNTAFVMVSFAANGVKRQAQFILVQEGGAWRIRTIRYDPMSVRQYTLTDVLVQGAEAIPAGAATAEEKSMDATIAGLSAASANDPGGAIAAHTKAIDAAPRSPTPWLNRCIEFKRQQRYAEALKDCDRGVALGPAVWTAYYTRADLHLTTKNKAGALADLSSVIRLENDISAAYYLRSRIYRENKQYDLALKDLTQVITLDFSNFALPDVSRANVYFDRGVCYYVSENWSAAIKDMLVAVRLEPNQSNPYYFLGNSYSRLKDDRSAFTAFDQMIKLAPSDVVGYLGRGKASAMLRNFEAAVRDFTYAIRLKPNDAEPYRLRGIIYREMGKIELALKDEGMAAQLRK